jgi:excisionase family DNA binding protein
MLENSHALLVTAAEAAKALAISPRKLWALTQSGEIPCVRIGRAVRYDPTDLRTWIEARKAEAARGKSASART